MEAIDISGVYSPTAHTNTCANMRKELCEKGFFFTQKKFSKKEILRAIALSIGVPIDFFEDPSETVEWINIYNNTDGESVMIESTESLDYYLIDFGK